MGCGGSRLATAHPGSGLAIVHPPPPPPESDDQQLDLGRVLLSSSLSSSGPLPPLHPHSQQQSRSSFRSAFRRSVDNVRRVKRSFTSSDHRSRHPNNNNNRISISGPVDREDSAETSSFNSSSSNNNRASTASAPPYFVLGDDREGGDIGKERLILEEKVENYESDEDEYGALRRSDAIGVAELDYSPSFRIYCSVSDDECSRARTAARDDQDLKDGLNPKGSKKSSGAANKTSRKKRRFSRGVFMARGVERG